MEIQLDHLIVKLQALQKQFNKSKTPAERYALIQAINHVAEQEIPFHGYWEDLYRDAMIADSLKKLDK